MKGRKKKIKIEFTGVRPGEKLHEELSAPGEEQIPTSVQKVYMLRNGAESGLDVLQMIRLWEMNDGAGTQDLVADVVAEFHELHRNGPPQLEVVSGSSGMRTSAA